MNWMRQKIFCSSMLLLLVPQLAIAAKPQLQVKQPMLTDIALQRGGILVGRVVARKDALSEKQTIVIRQNNKLVAEVAAGKNGQFMVEGLQGGIYEISSDQGSGNFRAWAADTAPPSAKQFALLIDSDEVVRGQWGWAPYPGSNLSVGQWIGISVGVAGLVVGTIALVQDPDPS
tara:strand:+ start:103 stop:624 length:522 start_codon:yes stop_codon:yes gene_type:complete